MGLSKINQKIWELYQKIEYMVDYYCRDDFNTREGSIVANIKCYDWLDENDVEKIIHNKKLQHLSEQILEEFDDERLQSIWEHTAEMEISHIKEELEDRIHVNNLDVHANAYNYWLQGDCDIIPEDYKFYFKHYMKKWKKFAKRKNNSRSHYLARLQKNDSFSAEENYRLNCFSPEVWQYGRSGGWLSICRVDELQNKDDDFQLEYHEDNHEFNEMLYHAGYDSASKQHLINDMQSTYAVWEETKAAIEYYVNDIEERVKHFKSCVLAELDYRIGEYVDEIEEKVTVAA